MHDLLMPTIHQITLHVIHFIASLDDDESIQFIKEGLCIKMENLLKRSFFFFLIKSFCEKKFYILN